MDLWGKQTELSIPLCSYKPWPDTNERHAGGTSDLLGTMLWESMLQTYGNIHYLWGGKMSEKYLGIDEWQQL